MLGDKEAVATLAVKDLGVARKFYEGVLGLKVTDAQGEEALTFKSGSAQLIVYRSQFAGTNQATAANFLVGEDIEKIVRGLADRGVEVRALRPARPDPQGRPARRGRFQDRVVQGPRRQHPLPDEHVAAALTAASTAAAPRRRHRTARRTRRRA